MKLCKDCKHYREDKGAINYPAEHICKSDNIPKKVDLVTGEEFVIFDDCYELRNYHGSCGEQGSWYEEAIYANNPED